MTITNTFIDIAFTKNQELRGTQVVINLGTCLLNKFNCFKNYYVEGLT